MSINPTEIATTKSPYADLTFEQLRAAYEQAGKPLGEGFQDDLRLRTPKGAYNLLAFLLSDQNDRALVVNRYSGFDKDISIDAERFGGCVVTAMGELMSFLHHENLIRSRHFQRGRNEQVPQEVLDGVLVNALAHNDWVGCGAPFVDVYCDRYEVVSFGMDAVSPDAPCAPVWPELMRVLVDLGLATGTGTGIPALTAEYGADALAMPAFGVNVVTLPLLLNTLYTGKFATPMVDDAERLCDVMGDEPRTAEDLMYLMQEAHYATLMERFVEPALAQGKIKKQGESADDRKQVYVRV
ncbi:MAG: hypothetical protein Q4D06_07795 [Coriobacteriia bacterium]|nr:hypothetical protein [Coriobacteriia bacterium]